MDLIQVQGVFKLVSSIAGLEMVGARIVFTLADQFRRSGLRNGIDDFAICERQRVADQQAMLYQAEHPVVEGVAR